MKNPQGSWAQAQIRACRMLSTAGWVLALAVTAWTLVGADPAWAGPNAGGTLLVHTDNTIIYTDDQGYSWSSGLDCGYAFDCPTENAGPCQSDAASVNPDALGSSAPQVWWVFAFFPPSSCPRMSSVSFGVSYPESDLDILGFGYATDDASFSGSFPFATDSGAKFDWYYPNQSQFVEICWIAGEVVSGTPVFSLGPHPLGATEFLDDSTPPVPDPVYGFSSLGFGTPGTAVYPAGFGQNLGACCLWDDSCVQLDAFDCANQGGDYHGDGSNCTTSACDLVGACCQPDGTCDIVSWDLCQAYGESYWGDGSVCSPSPCEVGACCLPDENCIVVTYDACWAYGGTYYGDESDCFATSCTTAGQGACCVWDGYCYFTTNTDCWFNGDDFLGAGTDCDPNPCSAPKGACCRADGSCILETGGYCFDNGWSYQGDYSSCSPNPCQPPAGACCFSNGSCSFVSQTECAALGGGFQGVGVSCSPDPCPDPEGACCSSSGNCTIQSSATCLSSGGSYLGNGTVCVPDPCPDPTGACCLSNGSCSVLTSESCLGVGGSYLGSGTNCSPNPCPDPTGACCRTDGTCFVTTSLLCASEGSSYQGNGASCVPDPCPDPTGACCLPNGSCSVITLAECAAQSGAYQGNSVLCNPDPCPDPSGACCFVSGTCAYVTNTECIAASGTYQGDDVPCSPNPCPEPTGACCFQDGTCAIHTSPDCIGLGGSYQGNLTVCSPNPCPQPPAEGACCFADGSCFVGTATACLASSGTYEGDETVCVPNPCPQPPAIGACCASSGICTLMTKAECLLVDGVYEGDESVCDPNPCPLPPAEGACCFVDGTCTFGTEGACVGADGVYEGDESACSPNPCPQPPAEGACCLPDGSCSLQIAASCAETSGNYEGDDTVCDPNPCPQPPKEGACCFEEGGCSVGLQDACTQSLGVYEGDDTVCSPNPCPQPPAEGACCLGLGVCAVRTAAICASDGGGYEGDESSCDPNPCPQPPAEGACCFPDGACAIDVAADCGTGNGSYEGDNTTCSPNPCPQPPSEGACCRSDGTCFVSTEATCGEAGSTYEGDDTSCEPNLCDQPAQEGACCLGDGACALDLEDVCEGRAGSFLGEGTGCDPHPCDIESFVELVIDGTEGSRAWVVSAPSFVESIEGFYRMGGELTYRRLSEWTREEGGVWRSWMNDAHWTERGLEYHLLFDGNIAVGAPDQPKRLRTTGHAVNGPRLFADRWTMVSAPVLVDGRFNYYDELVAIFGSQANDAWRAGSYDPARGDYSEVSQLRPTMFEPGRAYWLGAVAPPESWSVEGDAHLPLAGALEYAVLLRPGWNMVGNPAPYSVTLDRSLLRVAKDDTVSFAAAFRDDKAWVASSILTFDAAGTGSYKNELQTLPVWSGCWINNRTNGFLTLLIPAAESHSSFRETPTGTVSLGLGATGTNEVGEGSGPAAVSSAGRSAMSGYRSIVGQTGSTYTLDIDPVWSLELVARTSEESRAVLIGVVAEESPTGSDFGFLPPLVPGAKLSLAVVGGRGTLAAGEPLFQELRSVGPWQDERFTVVLNGSEAPVDLEWLLRPGSAEGWEFRLRDGSGAEIPLQETGRMEIPAGRRELEILARRLVPGTPLVRDLRLDVKPNPTTNAAELHYRVPFSGRILLQVFDPGGGRVWSQDVEVGAGEYTAVWDGRSSDGVRVASGIYFVRADAMSRETGATEHRIEKLVIVR